MRSEIISIFPEIVLAVSAMMLLMMGVFLKTHHGNVTVISKSSSFALILGLAAIIFTQHYMTDAIIFNKQIKVDALALFCKAVVIFSAIFVLMLSHKYLEENSEKIGFEFPILIILSVVGMMVMISATDMLSFYLGLELQSLALYVVAAAKRADKNSSEAGIKYFILGALASGIILYGISLIYGYAGSTNFTQIASNMHSQNHLPIGVMVGLVLVLVGICFKLSAAPFHMWAPDVYEGVPTPVTAFFAIVPKLAAAAVLMRLCSLAFGQFKADWQQVIIIISVFSMVIGAFAGIKQKNIKRLLAYSGIGHIGYILIGFAAIGASGASAVLSYFVVYILNSIGIFALIMSIKVKGEGLEKIENLAGLHKTNPKTAMLMAAMMISMIGLPIPPFAGFWGKFLVFSAAVEQGLFALAVIGVVSSVVAAYYYLNIIKVMYFDEAKETAEVKFDGNTIYAIIVVSLLSLAIFIRPELLTKAADVAASSLF